MPLEDDFSDIIKKARMGRGLSVSQTARAAGLAEADLTTLERGRRPSREETVALARALGLHADALVTVAVEGWEPAATPPMSAVETVLGDIGGYEVKGYVVTDQQAGEAVIIDTGYSAPRMLKILETRKLRLTAICLTHGHSDHAGGLDRLLERWQVPVYLGVQDASMLGWRPPRECFRPVQDGERPDLHVGEVRIELLLTPGHTPGGLCFRATGPSTDACFVGDTLFAGSIGRSNPFSLYPAQLDSVRASLMTLPADTVLYPGHGPATTVREERSHNPFAATT